MRLLVDAVLLLVLPTRLLAAERAQLDVGVLQPPVPEAQPARGPTTFQQAAFGGVGALATFTATMLGVGLGIAPDEGKGFRPFSEGLATALVVSLAAIPGHAVLGDLLDVPVSWKSAGVGWLFGATLTTVACALVMTRSADPESGSAVGQSVMAIAVGSILTTAVTRLDPFGLAPAPEP